MRSTIPPFWTGGLAVSSASSFALRLFGLGCGFLFVLLAARLLGPSGYGVVAVALSSATVVGTLAVLGVDRLAVREAARLSTRGEWGELRRFVRWSCVFVPCASLVAALLLAGGSLIPGPYQDALLLGSLAVPLIAMLNLLRGIIHGMGNVVAAHLPHDVLRWIATLAVLAILFIQDAASPTIVLAVVIAAHAASLAGAGAILGRLLRRRPAGEPLGTSPRPWLAQSMPFLTIALLGIVGTEISTILLGLLSGPREAGLYQPIARFAPVMLLPAAAIEMALAPRIVEKWEADERAGLQRMLRRSALAATAATIGVSAAILLASELILSAFGPDFVTYRHFLYWIAAAQVVSTAFGASPILLTMVGNMRSRMQAQTVNLVVQAGLAAALIPVFGAAGAAMSLAISIIVWSGMHWWLAWKTTGVDTSLFGFWRYRDTGAEPA